MNDVKHALLLIPRVKKENHLGGCRRSHRGGGVLECFFVLCTYLDLLSILTFDWVYCNRNIRHWKQFVIYATICYCDPQLIIDTWKGFHPFRGRVKMHCFCIDWSAIAAGYICPYLLHAWAQIQNSQLQTMFPWNVQNGSFLTKLSLTRGDIPVVCFERLLFNHLDTWRNCNYQYPCL